MPFDKFFLLFLESQGQFNDYVIKLRMEYNDKVGTFRRIIEIHQAEQERSQDYWQNCIKVCKDI